MGADRAVVYWVRDDECTDSAEEQSYVRVDEYTPSDRTPRGGVAELLHCGVNLLLLQHCQLILDPL